MAKRTAKSKNDNASKAIREFYDLNPQMKPKEIAEHLVKKGCPVEAQYVSVILSQYRKKMGIGQATRGRPRLSAGTSGQYGELRLVKQLISQTGSAEKARQALDAYIELMR